MTDAADKAGREARDWIVRLNSGHVTEAELAAFKAWRAASPTHGRMFEQERAFWTMLQGLEGATASQPRLGRRRFLVGGAAVAAGAAGVIMAPQLAVAWRADFTTDIGQMVSFALPDGSTATLNTNSAVKLDFATGQRKISLLKGEAEFVVPQATGCFQVAALDGLAEMAEGRFALRLDRDQAIVTAYQGQLRVISGADQRAVDLRPGEQARYGAGSAPSAPQTIETELAEAWRGGRVIFEGRAFAQAVHELARYLPERVVIAPHIDQASPVSGVFTTSQALAALDALSRTQGAALHRLPGVMILIA